MLHRTTGIALVMLLAVGCNNAKADQKAAAAAKSAEAAEIDQRSRIVAQKLVQQAIDDENKKREADERQRADARRALWQAAVDDPGRFLTSSDPQVANDGKRRLTSVSLTNKSKFSMTDIQGTVDYHGGTDFPGNGGDIMAQVPIQLTGVIGPDASMVFSEQQHTLSGSSIQLAAAPSVVTFTITSAKVLPDDVDTAPPTDAGAAQAANALVCVRGRPSYGGVTPRSPILSYFTIPSGVVSSTSTTWTSA